MSRPGTRKRKGSGDLHPGKVRKDTSTEDTNEKSVQMILNFDQVAAEYDKVSKDTVNMNLVDLETDEPKLETASYVFLGKYEMVLGTDMIMTFPHNADALDMVVKSSRRIVFHTAQLLR